MELCYRTGGLPLLLTGARTLHPFPLCGMDHAPFSEIWISALWGTLSNFLSFFPIHSSPSPGKSK